MLKSTGLIKHWPYQYFHLFCSFSASFCQNRCSFYIHEAIMKKENFIWNDLWDIQIQTIQFWKNFHSNLNASQARLIILDHLVLLENYEKPIKSRQNENKNASGNAWGEIFGSNYIRITVEVCLIFFVACLGNYGFLLNPSGLKGNILMNNI